MLVELALPSQSSRSEVPEESHSSIDEVPLSSIAGPSDSSRTQLDSWTTTDLEGELQVLRHQVALLTQQHQNVDDEPPAYGV